MWQSLRNAQAASATMDSQLPVDSVYGDMLELRQSRKIGRKHVDVLFESGTGVYLAHTSSLLIGNRVGVNVNTLDANRVFRSVLLVDLD